MRKRGATLECETERNAEGLGGWRQKKDNFFGMKKKVKMEAEEEEEDIETSHSEIIDNTFRQKRLKCE